MSLQDSELLELVKDYENRTKNIKDEIFRIAWHMRGGVQAHDLFWNYSYEDREVLSKIIKDNIETTNKTGMPLI